jgi:hypothetical protein
MTAPFDKRSGGPPPIPACRLWEKTSASGRRYLMGRLGGLRVLVFENRDRQAEGDATHVLLLAQAPDYPAAGAQAQQQPQRQASYRRPQPAHAAAAPFHDDEALP